MYLECAMSVHEADRDLQSFPHARLARACAPEHALTSERGDSTGLPQRDLAVAEIVADVLAEPRGFSTISSASSTSWKATPRFIPRTARRLFRLSAAT